MEVVLRDYQNNSVNGVKNSFVNGNEAVLLVLPTGGGKTIVFSKIAQLAIEKGSRVYILVHRIELIRQTVDKLQMFGVPHGVINPKFTTNLAPPVQVASVQTLVRRLDSIPAPDLIITDEAHHATAGNYKKITDHFSNALHLGVTATPERNDGKGLANIFDDLVVGPQIPELIELGYLTAPKVYTPTNTVNFDNVKIKRGDYDKEQVENLMDKPKIIGSAVKHYTRLCPGEPAVAFCASVKHAQHVAQTFRDNGYIAYAVDGSMDDDERKRILDGLGNGTVEVVTSCDLISEGTDIPEIVCAMLLRPTKSLSLYLQQVGRALRVSPGKEEAIILDHVGNTFEHGMPDAPRNWELTYDRKKKKRNTPAERSLQVLQCDNCFNIHMPQPQCPNCGNMHPHNGRTPEEVEGELKLINEQRERKRKKDLITEVAQAETMEELIKIQKKRGYKNGWAYNLYKSRKKNKK